MSVQSTAIFIGLSDVVGADRDQPAIANLDLAMELNQPFRLPPVLGAEASAAEDEDHGMRALQLGELAAFRSVIREFVVGKERAGNNIRSHDDTGSFGCVA